MLDQSLDALADSLTDPMKAALAKPQQPAMFGMPPSLIAEGVHGAVIAALRRRGFITDRREDFLPLTELGVRVVERIGCNG